MKGARPAATDPIWRIGEHLISLVERMFPTIYWRGSPYGSSGSKLSRSPFFIANNVTVDLVQAPVLV
jgi:hypothetical protein